MTHWHLLAALCCSFLPSRKFLRFLRFHLRRAIELQESLGVHVAKMAAFCLEAIKRTKARDFPPSTREIEGIMSGKGLTCSVNCVGGRVIEIPVTSSTTCAEVIGHVKKELGLVHCRNGFGLFESCGNVDKYLEEKYAISDVMSKWEKYEQHGINPDGGTWQLVFKLFSFYDPTAADLTKTELEFLFEQAFESVMARRFPADDATHVRLAALRTQYTVGDYEDGAYISDLVKVHPAQQEQLLAPDAGGAGTGTLRKVGTVMKGTLRGLGMNTLRRLKGGTVKGEKVVSDTELQKIKDNIVKQWKTLKGMSAEKARAEYMAIIQAWEGYGANLFEVEQTSNKAWPKQLWLAISLNGVGVFARGERNRLAFYKYETVLSFGAPVANKYKIMVDNVGSMLFETNMVLEIAKLMKEYIKEIVMRRR